MRKHLWVRLLSDSVVLNAATLGPVGKWTPAPGTLGSFAGLIWFAVAYLNLNFLATLLFALFSAYLAIQLCWEAEFRLQRRDPPRIVLDEFVAIPFCFLGMQDLLHSGMGWLVMLLGFAFFRFYDVLKPLGLRRIQNLPGGVGVVADDLAAALATSLTLNLIALIALFSGHLDHHIP